jgi:hypothetical protein
MMVQRRADGGARAAVIRTGGSCDATGAEELSHPVGRRPSGLVLSRHVSEGWQLHWLQDHPISVNLISGVIGFCGGLLALALVYNWFLDREWINAQTLAVMDQWYVLIRGMTDLYREHRGYVDGESMATVTWAPPYSPDKATRWGPDTVGQRFHNVGLGLKDEVLRFIELNAPSSTRTTAAAEGLFETLGDINAAGRALDQLSRTLRANVWQRYRRQRANELH